MSDANIKETASDVQKAPSPVPSVHQTVHPLALPGFFRDMDRFFEEISSRRWWDPLRSSWPGIMSTLPSLTLEGAVPRVDIIERDSDVVVRAEMPGIEKENIDISLVNNTLILRATSHKEEKEEEGEYHRQEISRSSYQRSIMLPAEIDEQGGRATFKNGVLEITFGKKEMTKRSSIRIE